MYPNIFRILLFLPMWLLLLHSCESDKSISVRVASYNVEFSKSTTPEEVGEMFKGYDLDIIGFCEAPDGDWTERVGKVLGMEYTFAGEISSANHVDKYKTILSRTPLENEEEFPLEVENGWNPASVVKAVTRIEGIPVTFYSLHICKAEKNEGHAYLLADSIIAKDQSSNLIVVGDFNNLIGDQAIIKFEEAGMRPVWSDLQLDLSRNYSFNAFDSTINLGVIDHIFYNTSSEGYAQYGGIIELEKPLADHKPVWAEIVFPLK